MQEDSSIEHMTKLEWIESQLQSNKDQIFELEMILESESRKYWITYSQILLSVVGIVTLIFSIINPEVLGNLGQEYGNYFGILCVFLAYLMARAINRFFTTQSIRKQINYIVEKQYKAVSDAEDYLLKEKEQSYD